MASRELRAATLKSLAVVLWLEACSDAPRTREPDTAKVDRRTPAVNSASLPDRVHRVPCDSYPYCEPDWAACARMLLLAAPGEGHPVVTTVDSGTRARVIDGQLQIWNGMVVVRKAFELVERYSTPDDVVTPAQPRRWRFAPSDTVIITGRETDGDSYANFAWRFRGEEATTLAFWPDPDDERSFPTVADTASVRLARPLREEWWARVRTIDGREGWTRGTDQWAGKSKYDEPATRCANP